MPFVFLGLGFVLVASALRNTQGRLGQLLSRDFTGPGNFFYWIAAISIIGSLGYINGARNVSRAFLALVLIVMVLSDQGFFAQITSAIENSTPTPATPIAGSGSSGSSSGNVLKGIAGNALKLGLNMIPGGSLFSGLLGGLL